MRRLLKLAGAVVVLSIAGLALTVWWNNRDVNPPDRQALVDARAAGIAWLAAQEIDSADPMLWWMVKEGASRSGDPALGDVYEGYLTNVLSPRYLPWFELFGQRRNRPVYYEQLEGLPDYNLLLIYGITCSENLANRPELTRQLSPTYCADHDRFAPACVTHQALGVHFMLKFNCGSRDDASELQQVLTDKVLSQLVWDPRLVDVYVQRMLVLALAGRIADIKPVWLARVLAAQQADGSWTGRQPLLPLGGSRWLSLTNTGLAVRGPRGSFHTTPQVVFLLSLLIDEAQ